MKKIGIFWYYENQVIGIAHPIDLSDQDSLGLIDSHYTHVVYWENLKHEIKALNYLEYEEIPRGRMIYDAKNDKTTVYMDAKLFKKSIVNKIAAFFEIDLADVVWKKDPHYKT